MGSCVLLLLLLFIFMDSTAREAEMSGLVTISIYLLPGLFWDV